MDAETSARGRRGSATTWLAVVLALSTLAACGGDTKPATTAAAALHDAASATADARSFVVTLPGAEITYQAPDRVQQVEHGQAIAASATNGGSTSSSGPFATTITKLFIGDRYYEADPVGSDPVTFTSAARCPNDQNAAEYVLRLLRAVAHASDITVSGTTYTFHLQSDTSSGLPPEGTATIDGGYVRTLAPAPSTQPFTIASVNAAPPVTAPASSTPTNLTCG